ncbi:unnamed protein product [Cylicostephanus goldi]|uniref:BPL/LPL catalytic domain-containing protein n=1 Tax=Cylicostephanus goldi TaxID=71465 RepID=A0A3P7MKH6_CYLGO|nr:unnamed protein product [Cylicostephanus goldi]
MRFQVHDVRIKDAVKTYENRFQQLAVTFNDTSDEIFAGSIDGDIYCWDMRRDDISYVLQGHKDIITGLALSPNGNYVLSNSMDCSAKMWDIRPFAPQERCLKSFYGHQHNFEKNLLKCGWSGDGKRITAGSSDRFVYVWDVSSRHILYKLPGHLGSRIVWYLFADYMGEVVRHRIGKIYISLSKCIYRNLAYEEYLLRHHDLEEEGEALLFWSNRPTVVIGRHQNPWVEANIPFLREYGIDLARRHSGGGAVYHDEGNLNISFLTTQKAHHRKKNLELLAKALNSRFAINVVPTPRDDMELQPAARITKGRAYHHLTLLVQADLMDFIRTNASSSVRAPAVGFLKQDDPSAEVLTARETITKYFSNQFEECIVSEVDVDKEVEVNEQVAKNLADLRDWNWIYGKSPKFWFEKGDRKQYVEAGIIKECSLGLKFIGTSTLLFDVSSSTLLE